MENSYREFINILIEQSAGLRATYHETLEYWEPDEPPITTLFGELGGQIVEDFYKVGKDVNQQIFKLIEAAMASGDDKLITAVATGLIEAIVAKAARQEDLWRNVSLMFGDLSRKHAEAWLSG
jgi:hypothetical protein